MEQINKITIRGTVGRNTVSTVADTEVARMSVATNYAYKDREGNAIIETQWHNITAFADKAAPAQVLESISKGDTVEVSGRMRYQRVTDNNGNEKFVPEIIAARVDKLDSVLPAQTDKEPGSFILDCIFGEAASDIAADGGMNKAKKCLKLGTIEGNSLQFKFGSKADRDEAIRMLQEYDGWNGYYFETSEN